MSDALRCPMSGQMVSMPDKLQYRVHSCPSCGKPVRLIKLRDHVVIPAHNRPDPTKDGVS